MREKAVSGDGRTGDPATPAQRGRNILTTLTLIRRMAVTISTRLFGRGTSRLPMY